VKCRPLVIACVLLVLGGYLMWDYMRTAQSIASQSRAYVGEKILVLSEESSAVFEIDRIQTGPYYLYFFLPENDPLPTCDLTAQEIRSHIQIRIEEMGKSAKAYNLEMSDSTCGNSPTPTGRMPLGGFAPQLATTHLTITCTLLDGPKWPDYVRFAVGNIHTDKGASVHKALHQYYALSEIVLAAVLVVNLLVDGVPSDQGDERGGGQTGLRQATWKRGM